MEKSKSFPQYSSSFSGEFGFEDRSNSYNFNGPCQKGNGFATSSDPELKRKKRIASYNVFTMEGKLKSNVRNSFKWLKSKFSDVRYGERSTESSMNSRSSVHAHGTYAMHHRLSLVIWGVLCLMMIMKKS